MVKIERTTWINHGFGIALERKDLIITVADKTIEKIDKTAKESDYLPYMLTKRYNEFIDKHGKDIKSRITYAGKHMFNITDKGNMTIKESRCACPNYGQYFCYKALNVLSFLQDQEYYVSIDFDVYYKHYSYKIYHNGKNIIENSGFNDHYDVIVDVLNKYLDMYE